MCGKQIQGPWAVKYLALVKDSEGELRVRGYATDSADAARHAFRCAAKTNLSEIVVYKAMWLRTEAAHPKPKNGEVVLRPSPTDGFWVFSVQPYAHYARVIDAKATHFLEHGD